MPEPESTDTVTKTTAAKTVAAKDAVASAAAKAVPGPAQPVTAKTPEEALAAATAEAAASQDRYLRAVADLENFRRRTVREKEELRLYAASRVLEDLLPALDNLSLGLNATQQPGADLTTLAGGVEMVLTQLKSVLANHGLKEINPFGQLFDPHQHEAISHLPSADVKAEHVLAVVRTGYSLNGRLLRPASVVVSSGPAKPEAEG
jgi:molecular chaperone GrpE